MRELGMDKNAIEEIRTFDRAVLNSNDRFYKRLNDVGEFYEDILGSEQQVDINSVEKLLDEVENNELYKVLLNTNEITLQIILLKVQGYSTKDIAKKLHISIWAIYARIGNLREKLKDII